MKINHFNRKIPKVDESVLIPASNGASMNPFIEWIIRYSKLTPKNIFEIGANMAQDAEALRAGFNLDSSDVWVFEPHPQLYKYILNHYHFNAFDYAIYNRNGNIEINAIDMSKNSNSGISSLRKHKDVPRSNFFKTKVKCVRMDDFIKKNKIESIDFLKLDVEGCNFEVLEGFGARFDIVKSIHIEAEHYEHWEGEKLWEDTKKLLECSGLEMVFFERHLTQSDSFWIKPEFIK